MSVSSASQIEMLDLEVGHADRANPAIGKELLQSPPGLDVHVEHGERHSLQCGGDCLRRLVRWDEKHPETELREGTPLLKVRERRWSWPQIGPRPRGQAPPRHGGRHPLQAIGRAARAWIALPPGKRRQSIFVSSRIDQGGRMSDNEKTSETLTDEDIRTIGQPTPKATTRDSDGVDTTDSDGVDSTDSDGVDSTDSDGVDSTDSDGVDSTDSGGVDSTDSDGVDSTDTDSRDS